MSPYIRLMRPHQYVKNFFVFAPLFFSFAFEKNIVINTLVTFVLFSFVASAIYIINDLMDIEEDRRHPTKKNRPLASGEVYKGQALVLLFLLATISFVGAFFIDTSLLLVLGSYFVLNIAYSLGLKHIALVDVFIIATGFVLRLFAGSVLLITELSMWIIIMTFLLATFLAIAKRRDDVLLAQRGQETRKNIDGYNLEFVNAAMTFMSAVIIVCYIQYSISDEVIARFGVDKIYLTAVFVILGILRYMQITFVENKSGSPTMIVLKDRFLQITIFMWLLSFVYIYLIQHDFV